MEIESIMHNKLTGQDIAILEAETPAGRECVFVQILPSAERSLSELPEESSVRANGVYNFLKANTDPDINPWAPVGLNDLTDPLTLAICNLWSAGMIRLMVAKDPDTGLKIGLASIK